MCVVYVFIISLWLKQYLLSYALAYAFLASIAVFAGAELVSMLENRGKDVRLHPSLCKEHLFKSSIFSFPFLLSPLFINFDIKNLINFMIILQLVMVIGISFFYTKIEDKIQNIISSLLIFSLFVIPLSLYFRVCTNNAKYSLEIMILTANVILADFGGLIVGKLYQKFGFKTSQLSKFSPSKTRQGFFIPLMLSIIVSYSLSVYFDKPWMAFIGVIMFFVAYCGDYNQSLIKRYCGYKDAGNLFFGHGGFFDRFDSWSHVCYVFIVVQFL